MGEESTNGDSSDGGNTETAGSNRCDYCSGTFPLEPITLEHDGIEYAFCSSACREALQTGEKVFTPHRGYRWYEPGVAALDAKLPQGILRNSFVLLSGQPGTRESELHAELAWRALERGESAVFVSFQEPPVSIVESFLTLGWNVLPFLESGDFSILDCFTHRVENRDRMLDRMNDWSAHLYRVASPQVTAVQDPSDVRTVESRLDDCLNDAEMIDQGVVVLDSLTELGSLVQPVKAYDFVKNVRADVCKGRFVPVFASAAYHGDMSQFPHDLAYVFDGVVDLELNSDIIEDALIKRIRVRKMAGALSYPVWTAYEFTSDDGLVTFDPKAEVEKGSTEEGSEEENQEAADEDDQ